MSEVRTDKISGKTYPSIVEIPLNTGGTHELNDLIDTSKSDLVTTCDDMIMEKGYHYDARAYGSTFDDATIQSALDAIGSLDRTLVIPPGTWTLSNDVTVPSNVNLKVLSGGLLSVATGKTLTINGSLEAEVYQIFDNVGNVVGLKIAYPEWFGAVGDETTNDATAMQAAMNSISAGGKLIISKLYGLGTTGWTGLTLATKIDITFEAMGSGNGFKLLVTPTQQSSCPLGDYIILKITNSSGIIIRNLYIDSNSLEDITCIDLESTKDSIFEKNFFNIPAINSFAITGLSASNNKYINNTIKGHSNGIMFASPMGVEVGSIIQGNTFENISGLFGGFHAFGGYMQHCTMSNNIIISAGAVGIYLGSTGSKPDSTFSHHVNIEGNVIQSCHLTGIECLASTDGINSNINITGNTISDCGGHGMYLIQLSESVVSSNIVRDNDITTSSSEGILLSTITTNGIAFKNVVVSNNLVYDSRVGAARTQYRGIFVNGKTYALENISITGNIVRNHLSRGIFLTCGTGGKSLSCISNTVMDNVSTAIDIQGGWSDSFAANNNTDGEIVVVGLNDGVSVTNNRCSNVHLSRAQDLQLIKSVYSVTTDATPLITWQHGYVPDNGVLWITANVVGAKSDGSERAAYTRKVLVYCSGGSGGTLVIQATEDTTTIESDATWDCAFSAYLNRISIRVTGVAATTINWKTSITMLNVS